MVHLAALLAVSLLLAAHPSRAAANEVIEWNDITMKVIGAHGQNPIVSTRTTAMVQAAVHDALNAISRRYDAYYFEGPGDPAASAEAAVAAAAVVLASALGDQTSFTFTSGTSPDPSRASRRLPARAPTRGSTRASTSRARARTGWLSVAGSASASPRCTCSR